MGKKRFNAKARQGANATPNISKLKKNAIYIDTLDDDEYDPNKPTECERSSKKDFGKANKPAEAKKITILSKKQRKRLQQIVEKQNKKKISAEVMEQLTAFRLPEDQLCRLVSITDAQTMGRKKIQSIFKEAEKSGEELLDSNTVKSKKRKRPRKKKSSEEAERDIEDDDESLGESDGEISDNSDTPIENKKFKIEVINKPTEDLPVSRLPQKNPTNESNSVTATKAEPLRKTVHVAVHRTAQVQADRLKLPIVSEEQVVMEAINENPIVIVAGETGSGKTTQIPQFLYEAGYVSDSKKIAVTEPRRLAAIAMSRRVAHEMNLSGHEVSYHVRFDKNVTEDTRILFMTDGILLEIMKEDSLLANYSVVIIDEAHERSVHTDILIGILSRIVLLRAKRGNPLKLIIMSATLHVNDFTENKRLFKVEPPLLKIEGRQYPVMEKFSKKTPKDYAAAAFRKTALIHSTEPQGGILIFLTGKDEIERLARKLRNAFPYKEANTSVIATTMESAENSAVEGGGKELEPEVDTDDDFDTRYLKGNPRKKMKKNAVTISLPEINLSDYKLPTEEEFLCDLSGDDSGEDCARNSDAAETEPLNFPTTKQPLWVLPLYSQLSKEKQERVFLPPPEGCRLCVVSTNIAETSITIPNIKYVVDSGMQKRRLYDKVTGVSTYKVTYTSKASAKQRAGRAGRVSAGHCYRLYSSACYVNEFPDFFEPDIRQKPVDELVLYMKCLNIIHVNKFPFPTPPDKLQLELAERRLAILGALVERQPTSSVGSSSTELPPLAISELGSCIAAYPVAPRYGKMLVLSKKQQLLPYTICVVSALSIPELFVDQAAKKDWQKKYRSSYMSSENCKLLGDIMVLLCAVCAAEYAHKRNNESLDEFCAKHKIRRKAFDEISNLRKQLSARINNNLKNTQIYVDPGMQPPTDEQANLLRQILLAGMGDRVAMKLPVNEIVDKKEKRRLEKAYYSIDIEEPVFIHSSSILNNKELSEWIVYQEVYEQQQGDSTKLYLRGITAIEPQWLLSLVPELCNITNICDDQSTRYDADSGEIFCYVEATYSRAAWTLPPTEIELHKVANFRNSLIMNHKIIYNHFAMYLLDGSVCPKLANYKYIIEPSSMLKAFTDMHKYCVQFKNAIIKQRVYSRKTLFAVWDKNPNYLFNEYYALLRDESKDELEKIWPPK